MQYTLTQDAVREIADLANLDPEESIRTAYSGRSMGGRTCLGIVGGLADAFAFVAAATDYLTESDDTQFSDIADIIDAFTDAPVSDGMGKRNEIFYWKNITVAD